MAGQCLGKPQDYAGQKVERESKGQKCVDQDSEGGQGQYWAVELHHDDDYNNDGLDLHIHGRSTNVGRIKVRCFRSNNYSLGYATDEHALSEFITIIVGATSASSFQCHLRHARGYVMALELETRNRFNADHKQVQCTWALPPLVNQRFIATSIMS